MEEIKVKVKISRIELIKSKFIKTLSTVEGYYKEAKGDVSVNQTYSPGAVYRRMEDIREALMEEIENLSNDIEISHKVD